MENASACLKFSSANVTVLCDRQHSLMCLGHAAVDAVYLGGEMDDSLRK